MLEFKDDLNNIIQLNYCPDRIISCVPSITELLADFGLEKEVVGITKFCVHPQKWFKEKTRIGGTKNLNIEKIKELQPDFIIASKEENTKSDIEELQKYFTVYVSDICTWEDCTSTIHKLSRVFHKDSKGEQIVKKMQEITFPDYKGATVAYIIWNDPIMTIGGDTFIQAILDKVKLINIYKNQNRYPIIDLKALQKAKPDYLFLSSEPFPFKEKHLNYYQAELPNTKVQLVDGELYSWYGTRLLEWHKKR